MSDVFCAVVLVSYELNRIRLSQSVNWASWEIDIHGYKEEEEDYDVRESHSFLVWECEWGKFFLSQSF